MSVHPLEQLRYIARQWDNADDFPAQEIAAVLAELADENPASLLQACRRLIEYYPSTGAAWWLSSRALSAAGAVEGIWEAAEELSSDPTARLCAQALPKDARVAFPGPPPSLVRALRQRNDLEVSHRSSRKTDLLLLRARAAGPAGLLFPRSTSGPLASAAQSGVPVWAVIERGTLLPEELWQQLLERALKGGVAVEVANADDLAAVVSEHGREQPDTALSKATCAPVAELLGWKA
jgi:hypothetical protein